MEQTATFALGCFWGPDDYFSKLSGVKNTLVGYSGGQKKNPTYEDLDDHTETVEIKFDPDKISYTELLDHFWQEHNPTYPAKTQYKSVIFYHDEEQKKTTQSSKQKAQKKYKMPILTEILPATKFYQAEEYHQKYLQKNRGAFC